MRFREYAPRASVLFEESRRHRWLRDDIDCTVLGDDPAAPRVCLFGEIRNAGFGDAFLLVVADDAKLEYRVERGSGSVEVDRDLTLIAAHALEQLIEDPGGRLANGVFRATLWAATTAPACTLTSGGEWTATFDDTGGRFPAAPGLAGLLPADRHLARALARMLASPVDLAARRDFEQASDAAAAAAGRPADRLDPATVLTPAGITAALTGADPDPGRSAAISGLAVTGDWPGDGAPDRTGTTVVQWHGLDWQLLF